MNGLTAERQSPSDEAVKERAEEKVRVAMLEQENARPAKKLAHSEAAVEILGEWVAFLDSMSESAGSENS